MEVAVDFEAVSIPFAAGAAIAAAICDITGVSGSPLSASLFLTATAVLTAVFTIRKNGIWQLPAAFFCLGIFCFISYNSLNASIGNGFKPALDAAELLKGCIDDIDFKDRGTNALLKALLTGDRGSLERSTVQTFRDSGASHILALSGLHLGIIYLIISRLLSIVGNSPRAKRVRGAIIILSSGFFTLMSGAGPSTVRAWLFITIAEINRNLPEREYDPTRVLMMALTIQLAIKPSVITSVGFQLSYLAMCGIFTVFPYMEGWYPKGMKFDLMRSIWTSAALSISCQIFTAPLVWMQFGTFPKYFLICNLLALPLTTILMTSAVATTLLSAIGHCPELLVNATEGCAQLLSYVLKIISSM